MTNASSILFGINLDQPCRYSLSSDIADAAALVAIPTEPQKKAGNYQKGHVRIFGLPITIETSKGQTRSGKDKDGNEWSIEMPHHYGYIKRTESEADGDHVDVFLGPRPESDVVYVVDQIRPDGSFDEHKCMIGFVSEKAAIQGYADSYSEGWKIGKVTPLTFDQFAYWVYNGDTGTPLAEQITAEGHVKYNRYSNASPFQYGWDENEHPRGDDGKFTDGSSGRSESYSPEPIDLDQWKADVKSFRESAESHINNQVSSPEKRESYSKAVARVLDYMPHGCLERLKSHLSMIRFMESIDDVTSNCESLSRKKMPEGHKVAGFWMATGKKGWLCLDGGNNDDDIAEIYAHEMSHAIDGPNHELSKDGPWVDAWESDIASGSLSNYATTNPSEGFAEFGRLLMSPGGMRIAKNDFPAAYLYWKNKGIA